MSEPNIDPKWNKDREFPLRRFLVAGVPVLLIALAVLLSPFKSCNSLGEQGAKNVYSPGQQNIGFVKKSNDLFQILLQKTDTTVIPVDLETLNKHYLAFEFDLPYAADNVACIEGADLRVVGIHQDYIPEEYREFFFNSRLPQLLKQQSEKISETYFKITLQSHSSGMRKRMSVNSIKLIPSMFKVALTKDPWTGTIYANENCLFTKENSVFLTFANTVLPLHKNKREGLHNSYKLVLDNSDIYLSGKKKSQLDYYQYYIDTYNSDRSVSIMLENNRDVNICCVGDSLIISSQFNFNQGKRKLTAGKNQKIAVKDGDKLIFYSDNNRKIAEFTVNTEDPSLILSSLTHSSLGTSRYVISKNQTDLFTQQMIRGFCRSLSNKDSIEDVRLSLDPFLSREFEIEIRDYLNKLQSDAKNDTKNFPKNQKEAEFDISITIMDMATGQVLASPFYMSQFDKERKTDELKMTSRNPALSRRSLGSTFKPILSLAAVQSNPDLLDLNTFGMYSDVNLDKTDTTATAKFHGRLTKSWAKGTNHWAGTDFVNFIAHSDDVYPVSLAALAWSKAKKSQFSILPVGESNVFIMSNNRLRFNRGQTQKDEPFPYWLILLSGANISEDTPISSYLFEGLFNESDNVPTEVCPDVTNFHFDTFYDSDNMDFRDRLVPWVLGQGGNEWSCMSIAESWCRMINKRYIHTRFVKYDSIPSLLIAKNEQNYYSINPNQNFQGVMNAWNQFLDKFEAAQKIPGPPNVMTLYPMYLKVSELNQTLKLQNGNELVLFSKTGTPDAYVRDEVPILNARKRYLDVGVYTFALIKKNELKKIKNKDPKPGKGIVCVVRLTRSYKCMSCGKNKKCPKCLEASGFWGSTARDFFVNKPERLKKLYKMTEKYL